MHLNAARVTVFDGVLEVCARKVARRSARIEPAKAQIHRVRAALHGGDQRIEIARGR